LNDNTEKVQVIKAIQNGGMNGVLLPNIKAVMPETSMETIRNIVNGLVESGLVSFSSLRDTYTWRTDKVKAEEKRNSELSRPEQVLKYLDEHRDGVYYDDLTEALGLQLPNTQVIVSVLKKKGKVVALQDPMNHAKRVLYLPEHAPKSKTVPIEHLFPSSYLPPRSTQPGNGEEPEIKHEDIEIPEFVAPRQIKDNHEKITNNTPFDLAINALLEDIHQKEKQVFKLKGMVNQLCEYAGKKPLYESVSRGETV